MIFSTRSRKTLLVAKSRARSSKEWSNFVGLTEDERPPSWSCAAIRILPSLSAELRSPAALFGNPATSNTKEALRLCAPASRRVCPSRSSAHGCAWLQKHSLCLLCLHHTPNPRATQYLLEKIIHRGVVCGVDMPHMWFRAESEPPLPHEDKCVSEKVGFLPI
jgi:hypothetical protein